MLIVEEAKLCDIERLSELLTILFSKEAEFTPHPDVQKAGLRMILQDASVGVILVLKNEKNIIGMVTLLWTISTALGGRVAFLEDMVVESSWQGRGGGSLLIEHAIAYAKQFTCKRLTLLSDVDNDDAHRFYKRFGFTNSVMQPMRLLLHEKNEASCLEKIN